MAKLLDKQRYKCALGAMQTVQAIEHALPILHAGPGCAQKLSESTEAPVIFPRIFFRVPVSMRKTLCLAA